MISNLIPIGAIACMIVMYACWLHRHRQIIRAYVWARDISVRNAHISNTILKQCELIQDTMWQGLYARINVEHTHYEMDGNQLPGLVTLKCLDCDEIVGTMPQRPGAGDGELPIELVRGHIQQKFDEIVESAKDIRAQVLLERNAKDSEPAS